MRSKLFLSSLLVLLVSNLQSQVSLSLGTGVLKGFGVPKTFY